MLSKRESLISAWLKGFVAVRAAQVVSHRMKDETRLTSFFWDDVVVSISKPCPCESPKAMFPCIRVSMPPLTVANALGLSCLSTFCLCLCL